MKNNKYFMFGVICLIISFFCLLICSIGFLSIYKNKQIRNIDEDIAKDIKVKLPEHIGKIKVLEVNPACSKRYELTDYDLTYNSKQKTIFLHPTKIYSNDVKGEELYKYAHYMITLEKNINIDELTDKDYKDEEILLELIDYAKE